MLRTGAQYRDSLKDGRQVWINGERVKDVTTHPAFKPIVDIRARIYDMAHEAKHKETMAYRDAATGEENCIGYKLPHTQEDWHAKRRAIDAVMRPRHPQRSRSAILEEHRASHPACAEFGHVPRLGQYRSQGRPLKTPPGSGPRHAAAPGQGDRQGHRGAGREI